MKQRGGTLLGFIIGLVLGLGIALGVAVYVTKVPVPFMNKSQSRTAEQDAAEAKKNKDWDPNAPLYGKNPAKPAVVEADAPASANPPAVPAATPASTTASPVPAVVDPKAAKTDAKADAKTDPLGDLAKAKADPFNYFIQTGAFRTEDDAQAQRAKLALGGMDAKITEREQSGRMVYRVRVGPFEKRDDADKVKDKLEAGGYETVIVRIQK
jgi:cell division protein FtsN